ncbi:hypothetical protein CR513_51211, partial [Mucuna pruriens]
MTTPHKKVNFFKRRQSLATFVNGTKNLKKILKYKRNPNEKYGIGYDKGKDLKKNKFSFKIFNYGKNGHTSFNSKNHPKKRSSNISKTNYKGPKQIRVPKNIIIYVAYLFNCKKKSHVMKRKIAMIGKVGKTLFPSRDNVLFVERQLCDSGHDFSFNKGDCIVRNPNGSLMFTTKRQNNLYKINLFDLTNQNKLEHASLILISKLNKHNLVRGLPKLASKIDLLCDACKKGNKSKDLLHPRIRLYCFDSRIKTKPPP